MMRPALQFPPLICFALLVLCLGFSPDLLGQNLEYKGKAFSISGGLAGNLSYYNMDGIPARRNPYGYSLSGNVTMRIYGVTLPFSVMLNQQGTTFSQPFSQYGVSPYYKWVKLHLGYRSMRFSEFTLNGVTFLGAGLELTPGKFRFSAMVGRFREARAEAGNLYRIPQYKRNGYAISAGFGKETFVDLTLFQASDKLSSLQMADTIGYLPSPEANTALGLTGNFQILKNKLNLSYDLGASVHTRNLNAQLFDDAEGMIGNIQDWSRVNASSNLAGAARTSLRYTHGGYNLGIDYRYVQSGYKTLGANYLLADVEMITLSGGGRFFKNTLGVQASYGIQNNNLSERNFATTGRNIGSLNVNWQATEKLNFNLGYSNFSIYQTLILDSLFADSIVLDQTNHQINAGLTYLLRGEKNTHTFGINAMFQDLSDRNEGALYSSATRLFNANLTYALMIRAYGLGIHTSAGYQNFAASLLDRQRYTFSLGLNKKLIQNKLSIRLRQSFIFSETANFGSDRILTSGATLDYKLFEKHSLSFNASLTSRKGNGNFSESRLGVGYRMRF